MERQLFLLGGIFDSDEGEVLVAVLYTLKYFSCFIRLFSVG